MAYSVNSGNIATLVWRFAWRCVRIVWVFACVFLLLGFFNISDGLLIVPMVMLSFPAGLAGLFLAIFFFELFPSLSTSDTFSDWGFPVAWVLIFAAGYWQWFILLPRLVVEKLGNKTTHTEKERSKQGKLARNVIPSLDITIMWFGASIMVLGFTISGIDNYIDENELGRLLELFLERSMLMLSFPMGYICTFMSGVIFSLFAVEIESLRDSAYVVTVPHSYLVSAFSAYWVSFLIVGYLQWFILFPRVLAKLGGEQGQRQKVRRW